MGLKEKAWWWALTFAWMLVIFCFSSQANSSQITAHYFGPLNILMRKLGHMSEYAILFLLLKKSLPGNKHGELLALLLAVLYAASDEWHQSFVPGRSPAASDVFIDFIGALIGLLANRLWLKQKANPRHRKTKGNRP